MKIYLFITFGFISIFLNTCNVIVSKTYGDDTTKILFDDKEVKCTFQQVIYGSSCMSNIYLDFIPKSNFEIQVKNLSGKMKWKQNGKIIQSPFLLSHIEVGIYNNGDRIKSDSFLSNLLVTEQFKTISGETNFLQYNIEFSDSTYKNIPLNVDQIIIDFEIDITTKSNTKHYSETINLNAITHYDRIPSGRND